MSRYYGSNIEDFISRATIVIGSITLIGTIAYTLRSCGAQLSSNRDNFDLEKTFDYVIDYKGEKGTSITKINRYSDYEGQSSEIITQDGLHILTGLTNSELVNVSSYEEAYNRALELSGGQEDEITSYDQLRELDYEPFDSNEWNKKYFNFNYDFDYAITESSDGVIVKNIRTWRDWDSDDKVQFIDMDGNVYLSTFDNTSLVNSSITNEEGEELQLSDAVYDYALSLAGSEERLYGDVDKEKGKVLVKKPKYNYDTDSSY